MVNPLFKVRMEPAILYQYELLLLLEDIEDQETSHAKQKLQENAKKEHNTA